jgi:glycosyltransferase involved in cell wall biosynthesis
MARSQRRNDCSEGFPVPVILVELARNFGEHAAVLEAYRRSRGRFVVNLDDDLQNPLSEALKLLRHLRESGRRGGVLLLRGEETLLAAQCVELAGEPCATFLLGKPRDLYLSSFRALRRELVERIVRYRGPYPYIDGLILGATNRI